MGCGCSGSSNTTNNSNIVNYSNVNNVIIPQNCTITEETLKTWKRLVTCVKDNNKLEQSGLTEFTANQILGLIQSALNYPENYCTYHLQLDFFINNILILIIANVPECSD